MSVEVTVSQIVSQVSALHEETSQRQAKHTRGSAGGAYLSFLTGTGDKDLRELIEAREAVAIKEDEARLKYKLLSRALTRVLRNYGLMEKPAPRKSAS
jgi:hypothetical protein